MKVSEQVLKVFRFACFVSADNDIRATRIALSCEPELNNNYLKKNYTFILTMNSLSAVISHSRDV